MDHLDEAAARVQAGDTAAFQQIVEATSDRLLRLSARLLGSVADAEDVLQEVYVKAHRALSDGDFDRRSSVMTWLYRVVTNASIDALRSRARRPKPTDELDVTAWDGLASAEATIALKELQELVSGLPDDQRAALVLKVVEGLSSAEVAAVLQCSEGAVEQRLVRARATLRARGGQS